MMFDELKMIAARVREMREILDIPVKVIAEARRNIWLMKMQRMISLWVSCT